MEDLLLGLVYVLLVETNPFPELVVIFSDYTLQTSIGTFSILRSALGPLGGVKLRRWKGRDLTQSYGKSPYTHRKIQEATRQHKNRHQILWFHNERIGGMKWLFNVKINDISVIYVTAHRCAGGLKKLDIRTKVHIYRN